MIKNNKASLADKIAGILNTAPKSYDPEDTVDDETSAKLQTQNLDDDDDEEEELLSKFRKQNIDLLEDVDEKYKGKKASRKSLNDSNDETEDNDLVQSDIEEDNDGEGSNEELEEAGSEDEDVEDESESDYEDGDIDFGDSSNLENEVDDTNFKHLKDTNLSTQVKKGLCVRNQMSMWESLLEMRIQLQKCVIPSNKFPQSEIFNELKKDPSQEFANKVADTKTNLFKVLDKLIQLQTMVIKQYPETKNLDKIPKKNETSNDDDDEEIPSDTEEERSEDEAEDEKTNAVPRKRKKLDDYEKDIEEQHTKYRNYRNSVIQKWNDKTRIAVAKSNTATHSVLNQIDHILSDKPRLTKRTQLKRSEYNILGHNKQETEKDETKSHEEYNSNIFDDDDFYHQLLRELIEVKSADLTDPVQLGRQWIQLQNLRSKMKRKIDTKATKGRKIRYAVHTKLVNFMAPIDENLWTDEAKTELYSSLFGKNQPISV